MPTTLSQRSRVLRKLLLTIVLLLVYWKLGFFRVLMERPNGYHQWSQCLRASIALNYAEEDMNLFKPRVHECRNTDGITGCEFPIINYAAALCYKTFGFHEFWYRLIMLTIITIGVFAAYQLSLWLNGVWLSLCITLMWLTSPVLNYYMPSFIPDVASLGFAMMGWYFFFRHIKSTQHSTVWLSGLFFILACLVKVSSLVHPVALLLLLGLDRIGWLKHLGQKNLLKYRLSWLVSILVLLGVVVWWYQYAVQLNALHNLNWFILERREFPTWAGTQKVFSVISWLWVPYYYNRALMLLLPVIVLALLVFARKNDRLLWSLAMLQFGGFTAFFVINLYGFKDHDYYIITMLPMVFFFLLAFAHLVKQQLSTKKYWIAIALIFGLLAFDGIRFSVKHQYSRYFDFGGHAAYTIDNSDYYDLEPRLRALGINRDDRVTSVFDFSPISTLYLMDQKGYAADKGRSREFIQEAFDHSRYVIMNDTAFFKAKHPELLTSLEQMGVHRSLIIYRIRHDE